MSFYINNVALQSAYFNSLPVNSIYYNGVWVWGVVPDFEWGEETAIADATWFQSLSNCLYEGGADASWIGKTKALSGTHRVRCVDVNRDGSNTVTFQLDTTVGTTVYDTGSMLYGASDARAAAIAWGEDFVGKDYVLTVQKQTLYEGDMLTSSETFFIPSLAELNVRQYPAEHTIGVTEPYAYYTSNTTRIKYDNLAYLNPVAYWTRTIDTSYTDTVCAIAATGEEGSGTYNITEFDISPMFVIGATKPVDPPTPSSFDWGDETAEADEAWFKSLYDYVTANGTSTGWIGKTKSVTLTTGVLGTTTHLIRCVGVDCDGANTVTFQTANCLSSTVAFGNVIWNSASIKNTYCANYYNAFPGKAYIKTVSKGTCRDAVSSQTGTPTYTDEQVFIPSECEMGKQSYSSSFDEFCAENTDKIAYQYYDTNSACIKNQGDSDSACIYWTRSRRGAATNQLVTIGNTGGAFIGTYDSLRGFAPAFVIG